MKTIIIYDTRRGFTKECAEFIKTHVKDAVIKSMKYVKDELKNYDEIYIGSYIVKGAINVDTKKFLKENYSLLREKKLKMFISALYKEDYNHALQTSLHPEIFYHADIVNCGGRLIYKELSMMERRQVRKFMDLEEDMEVFYEEKLLDLIEK